MAIIERGGCGTMLAIAALGVVSHFADIGIGAHLSIRIPETGYNASLAGGLGKKERTRLTVPRYISERIGSNIDLFGPTVAIPFLTLEGFMVTSFGRVPEVPMIDGDFKVAPGRFSLRDSLRF